MFYVNTLEITNLKVKIYEYIVLNTKLYTELSNSSESAFMNYYRNEMLVEEIIATNKIEGIRSTRKDLLEAEMAIKSKTKTPRFYYVLKKYKNLQEEDSFELSNAEDLD